MPAIKQIITDEYQVLVWKIEEDIDFFAHKVKLSFIESQEYANITHAARKLEWLASRFVQRQLIEDSLVKDEYGKPHLSAKKGYISMAHCKDFACAIYGPTQAVGIDIEPIHPKVLRIAEKFLNTEERAFIDYHKNTEHVIAAWCVKEAVYKWYGKKTLSFKQHIRMQSFSSLAKFTTVDFSKDELSAQKKVHLERIQNCMLAYTL